MRDPHVWRQPATVSGAHAEARHAWRLLTRLAQHLHAETNSEERRSAGSDIRNDGVETTGAERRDAGAKRADAWQDQSRRLAHDRGIGGDGNPGVGPPESARTGRDSRDAP